MWTLDASVVTRSFDPAAPTHIACRRLLDYLDQHRLSVYVPQLLIVEISGSLRRVLRDPIRTRLVVAAWKAQTWASIVPLDNKLLDVAAEIAADRALKGADAIYVAVAQQYGCTLVSLDREQRERAAPLVPTLTPDEALIQLLSAPS